MLINAVCQVVQKQSWTDELGRDSHDDLEAEKEDLDILQVWSQNPRAQACGLAYISGCVARTYCTVAFITSP